MVEIDGGYHARRQVEDARRDEVMSGAGISILRISNHVVVNDTEVALDEVRRMIRILQEKRERFNA